MKIKKYLIIFSSILIPGSGHVFLKKPKRGLMLVLWMFALGYITFHITNDSISYVGRYAGGVMVYLLSVMEVIRIVHMASCVDNYG